jgi:dephospho-CoA kinase
MILRKSEIRDALTGAFGAEILDESGQIDRQRLGEKAFEGESQIKTLNRIVHPALLTELKREMDEQREKSDVVFVDAALIAEWGIAGWFERVIVVTCPTELKLERLLDSGMSEEAARKRLACQMSDEERTECADFVIDNSGTKQDLKEKASYFLSTLALKNQRFR